MSTTVLAYLILFVGFITFLAGAFGVFMLLFEDLAKTGRVPFGYYVPNGSIDQTRKRNRKAVRDDRWNAVPISNYRRRDE